MSAEQYIDYVLLDHLLSSEFDAVACGRWMPAEDFDAVFEDAVRVAFHDHGFLINRSYSDITNRHKEALVQGGFILSEGDEFTGRYNFCAVDPKDRYIKSVLNEHGIANRIKTLGSPALDRALHVLATHEGWLRLDENGLADQNTGDQAQSIGEELVNTAPASDRVVSFSDNQVRDLDQQASELIDAVSSQNQIPDAPGLREIILGQLRAGRELIRGGSFRMYILQVTLIDALQVLAKRYEREIIGSLAAALITALVKQIGIDA